MREIKFMFWDVRYMKMVGPKSLRSILMDDQVIDLESIEVLQYIGVNDKTGVEIYEGDIVKFKNFMNHLHKLRDTTTRNIGLVEYDEDRFVITQNGYVLTNLVSPQHIEVIGNKFENPDLLEKAND